MATDPDSRFGRSAVLGGCKAQCQVSDAIVSGVLGWKQRVRSRLPAFGQVGKHR